MTSIQRDLRNDCARLHTYCIDGVNDIIESCLITTLCATAHKIIEFVGKNWGRLTAYTIAWTLIIAIMGRMHGFTQVGKPLAIGLGVGVICGVLTGIVLKGIQEKPQSGWQFIRNNILRPLDKGTNALLIAVCVTLINQLMPFLPYGMGGIIGLSMGNHMAIQILLKGSDNVDPTEEQLQQNLERRLAAVEQYLEKESKQGEKI